MVAAQISGSCSKSMGRTHMCKKERERERRVESVSCSLGGWMGGWLVGRSVGRLGSGRGLKRRCTAKRMLIKALINC